MTARSVVQVVRSDAFAGVERYVCDTAGELARRGWRVTVIGGNAERMRAELPSTVPHVAAKSVADVARALWRVGRNDVVHAHMTAAELPAALLKRRVGGLLVMTRHFATPRGRSVPGRLAARLIERRVDLQIAISRFVADATPTPTLVVHNGVQPSAGSMPREQTVLVLQRLEAEKNTATGIRAWAASGLAADGWRMVVHGRGSQAHELGALARDVGVADSVEFAGYTTQPRNVLARAGMLLATASAEPFGLTVIEAMAEATPVVATDSGAHRETLGDDGSYFTPGDVTGCAAALRALAGDSHRRAELGAALQARHATEFSIGVHVDRLEAAYEAPRAGACR